MKNKDIKNLIKNEYTLLEVSPISDKITQTPIQEKPPFKKAISPKKDIFRYACSMVFCMIMLALVIIPTFNIQNNNHSELTSYILEINPSICITTDSSDNIISICSLSNDGDVLLSDDRFENIIGNNLDNGLKSVIDASIDIGYFENYDKRIVLFAINNQESFAMKKTLTFESFLNKHLQSHNLESIEIDKGCMSIADFKHRMNFDNNFDDLDKMRDDIRNRPKYFDNNFTPLPPPVYY